MKRENEAAVVFLWGIGGLGKNTWTTQTKEQETKVVLSLETGVKTHINTPGSTRLKSPQVVGGVATSSRGYLRRRRRKFGRWSSNGGILMWWEGGDSAA